VWLGRYLDVARPGLVAPPDPGALFVTRFGQAFRPEPLMHLVRRYVDGAKLGKSGSCHLFRHTMATLMLEGGADIRYILEMLGHVKLDTTQIYTQVSIRRLCEVHAATHPGAKPEPNAVAGAHAAVATGDAEPTEPAPTVEALFAELNAEDGDGEVGDGEPAA